MIIVTEFMARGSLYQYLREIEGSLLGDQAMMLRIVTDVSLGMNYLHGADCLHRDLNCKNILVRVFFLFLAHAVSFSFAFHHANDTAMTSAMTMSLASTVTSTLTSILSS